MGNRPARTTAMPATEWEEVDQALPADLPKGAMGLSGFYHLEPLLLHSVNDDLALDKNSAQRTAQPCSSQRSAACTSPRSGRRAKSF